MSYLIVQVVKIDNIKSHPNADQLQVAIVGGWEIVIGKGNFQAGQKVVHIQPDSMVPKDWADKWDVTKYLSWKKEADKGRVRAARLRGVASFGFLVPNESGAEVGADLAEHYGISKYEPPPPPVGMSAGQMRAEHPLFHRYTDIQNLRNFKDKLRYDKQLVITEKIHGTNSRVGWVRRIDGPNDEFELVVGTHRTQRDPEDCGLYGIPLEQHYDVLRQVFEWAVEAWERDMEDECHSVLFFGEIYGAGVQDLHYGQTQEKGYRIFDISINGQYLPWDTLEYLNSKFRLPLVPVLGRGMYDFEQLLEIAQGDTTLEDSHIREGVVIRPWLTERTWGKGEQDPNPKRMIFKLISDEYLLRRGNTTEYH